jgi:plastocyanin
MKHLIAVISFAIPGFTAQATVHIVTCQNGPSHFLPVTVDASLGDTIHWTWVSGSHVVGVINETDIPEGADSWNALITQAYPTFDYVVTVLGDYHYVCHPDAPHDEDGYIVVSAATAIHGSVSMSGALCYPNPFTDQLTVETTAADRMVLYNVLGDQVEVFTLTGRRTTLPMDAGTLPKGIYFCSLLRDGVVMEIKRLVRR